MPNLTRRTALASAASMAVSTTLARAAAPPLVIYHALDFVGSAAKAFTAKTGVAVQLVEQDSTGLVLGRVAAEGDHPKYDMLWLEGSAIFERLANPRVLHAFPDVRAAAAYTPVGRKVATSDYYLPTNVSTTTIAANTKKVGAEALPKSWADLANPAWSNTVAAKDPNLSGPAYQWLAGMFQTNGEAAAKALLEKVLTNKALSGLPSGGSVNKALLTGDAKVAIAQDSATYSKVAAGEPLVAIYPSEGVVALPSCVAAGAQSQNLDGCRQFMQFVLSPEGQAAMMDGDDADYFFVPIIEGVAAKPGRKTDINFVFLDNATAGAHEAEWKKWYRDHFVP